MIRLRFRGILKLNEITTLHAQVRLTYPVAGSSPSTLAPWVLGAIARSIALSRNVSRDLSERATGSTLTAPVGGGSCVRACQLAKGRRGGKSERIVIGESGAKGRRRSTDLVGDGVVASDHRGRSRNEVEGRVGFARLGGLDLGRACGFGRDGSSLRCADSLTENGSAEHGRKAGSVWRRSGIKKVCRESCLEKRNESESVAVPRMLWRVTWRRCGGIIKFLERELRSRRRFALSL